MEVGFFEMRKTIIFKVEIFHKNLGGPRFCGKGLVRHPALRTFLKSQIRRCSVGIRCGMKASMKWPIQAQLKALQAITSASFPQFLDRNDSIRFQELQNKMTKIYRKSFRSTSGYLSQS